MQQKLDLGTAIVIIIVVIALVLVIGFLYLQSREGRGPDGEAVDEEFAGEEEEPVSDEEGAAEEEGVTEEASEQDEASLLADRRDLVSLPTGAEAPTSECTPARYAVG